MFLVFWYSPFIKFYAALAFKMGKKADGNEVMWIKTKCSVHALLFRKGREVNLPQLSLRKWDGREVK